MVDEGQTGASVALQNVSKHYQEMVAVDGVSLEIEPGEFVTLLGPSGSGKTTTLNMIAGFASVTSGEILMDGRPISALPPYRRNIGMVFQHYALFPHMTTFDNVAFPLRQRRVAKAETRERVDAALELVGLAGVGERYPRQLSGGQQQRVALARAIVFNPRLLLMDEPLGALDKKLREWLQLEIKRIHRELGITFIYVTHDQEEALVLSDRIAVFNHGRIEQVGAPVDLYEEPETLFVAEFLGDSTIFRGRTSSGGGGSVTVAGEGFELRARRGRARLGERGALVVRPERIRVLAEGEEPGESNVLSGTIREAVYLGSSRKLTVDLDACGVAVVREGAAGASDIRIGDRVRLAWRWDESVVLPDHWVEDDVLGNESLPVELAASS